MELLYAGSGRNGRNSLRSSLEFTITVLDRGFEVGFGCAVGEKSRKVSEFPGLGFAFDFPG